LESGGRRKVIRKGGRSRTGQTGRPPGKKEHLQHLGGDLSQKYSPTKKSVGEKEPI